MSILILLLIIIFALIILLAIWNILQKNHTILRNFPIIGYMRYFAEFLGVYLRQYFYARDREELPFNRTERTWVYEASENVDTTIGFGSTRDRRPLNTIYFVDSPFPVLKRDVVKAHSVTIG
ncbi:hypothetical protein [Legionella santicrucis]|uniref:hypothetical protein n=1 Tax=Legionella santicrucis TaxID=45074 RepID=UPI001ED98C6A|nr:hypothetical protein [Legionella santicrucis]